MIVFIHDSKLKKLSEDSLTKQPEEVFDVLEKLGEGCVLILYVLCDVTVECIRFAYIMNIDIMNVFFLFFRSYGSVFKAIHKESGQVVAIKQVPVESDLQEIIKEISIMQQCDR